MSNNIGVMSRILYNSIKHFGLKDEEITFDVTNDKVHMRNYFESSERELFSQFKFLFAFCKH